MLVLFSVVIVIISFGWLALFRHTYSRCELLCTFIITQLTLNKEIQFNLNQFCSASEFCEWVQVEIDVYIPHLSIKGQASLISWFSAAGAAAIVHRNHFFRLYQQNKSSESKVKFRQASNCCKRVLEAAKLAYANKTKESITSQKLGSRDFW